MVSTFHSGIPEAVEHGETGLLAPERDHEILSQNISRYLQDDGFWSRSSQRGRERVYEKFNLHTQTALLEDLYESLESR